MSSNNLKIEELTLRKAALVFRAIDHKLRQQILHLLHKNANGMPVTSIYKELQIEQSVASQHLSILRQQNIVKTRREVRHIYYSINYERLQQIHKHAEALIQSIAG